MSKTAMRRAAVAGEQRPLALHREGQERLDRRGGLVAAVRGVEDLEGGGSRAGGERERGPPERRGERLVREAGDRAARRS